MSKVNDEDVARIAALAQLELGAEERAAMVQDLSAILDYVAQLSEIATAGIAPLAHLHGLAEGEADLTLRADEVRPGFTSAEALANAPAQREQMFEVPKII